MLTIHAAFRCSSWLLIPISLKSHLFMSSSCRRRSIFLILALLSAQDDHPMDWFSNLCPVLSIQRRVFACTNLLTLKRFLSCLRNYPYQSTPFYIQFCSTTVEHRLFESTSGNFDRQRKSSAGVHMRRIPSFTNFTEELPLFSMPESPPAEFHMLWFFRKLYVLTNTIRDVRSRVDITIPFASRFTNGIERMSFAD